jgi:hypothetical protein
MTALPHLPHSLQKQLLPHRLHRLHLLRLPRLPHSLPSLLKQLWLHLLRL